MRLRIADCGLRIALLGIVGMLAPTARGAHVLFVVRDSVGTLITNADFTLSDLSAPLAFGDATVSREPIITNTYNGTIIVSNLAPATYRVDLVQQHELSSWQITVPDTNGLVDGRQIISSAAAFPLSSRGYSMTSADARFVQKTNGWSIGQVATNLVFNGSTNAFRHTNGAGAGLVLTSDGTNAFWATPPGAGGGEANLVGHSGTTNTTDTFGLEAGKSGVTLLVKTLQQGAGIALTNQGTNIVIASTGTSTGYVFNANQFGLLNVSNVSLKSGVLLTNPAIYGAMVVSNSDGVTTNFTVFRPDVFAGLYPANQGAIWELYGQGSTVAADFANGHVVIGTNGSVVNQALTPTTIPSRVIAGVDPVVDTAQWQNGSSGEVMAGVSSNGAIRSVTNIIAGGSLTASNLTASRAVVTDANQKLVSATGTPDGTKYLRDDGTYAVPPGTATFNANQFDSSGAVDILSGALVTNLVHQGALESRGTFTNTLGANFAGAVTNWGVTDTKGVATFEGNVNVGQFISLSQSDGNIQARRLALEIGSGQFVNLNTNVFDLNSAASINNVRGITNVGATKLTTLTASRPLQLDANNLVTASAIVLTDANSVSGALPIANGGTAATAAINARTNLGVAITNSIDMKPSTPAEGHLLFFNAALAQWTNAAPPFVSDTAFGSSWDGVTTIAPSKNAVWDRVAPLQNGDGVLSNMVGTAGNNVTNVSSGWAVHLSTTTGTLTANATNALTLMATNATTYQADFKGDSGSPLVQTADYMRTNVTLYLTNPIVGRVITFCFRGDLNAVDRTVTVATNGLTGNWPVQWGFNCPTNGATAFTVTNNIGAELSILCKSNAFSAFYSPQR